MVSSEKKKMTGRFCAIASAMLVASIITFCFLATGLDNSVAANPTSGDCGADLHWEIDTNTGHLTITGTGAMENYDTSDTRWGGYTVKSVTFPEGMTAIGAYAFYRCTQLTSVTIPDNVTHIRVNAFYGCSGLTSVTIGTGVTDILMYAFEGCSSLTSLTLPDNVVSLGDNVFNGCTNLATVSIGAGITDLGTIPFGGCNKLVSFTVADANTAYSSEGGVLFNKGKTELIKYPAMKAGGTYTIPASVDTINMYAFTESVNLTSITIPGTVATIESNAFNLCRSLTSATIEAGVGDLGNYAFYNCPNLTTVSISDGITSIENDTFYGCSSLTTITLPNSITSIGSSVFYGCSSLTTITIPDNVTIIWGSAFEGCTGLTDVNLGSGVTTLEGGVFEGCTSLTTITIPDSVTTIGYGAFRYCSNLETVNIGTGLASISDIFYGCNKLKAINVAEGNTEFSSVDGVLLKEAGTILLIYPVDKLDSSYAIPLGVLSIDDETFARCRNLVSVTIPDSVTSMGDNVFDDCSNLETVNIGTGLASMGDYVFSGCNKLKAINVAEDNTAFKSQDGVLLNEAGTELLVYPVGKLDSSYAIPSGVLSIGNHTFSGCYNLTAVTIPDSVTSIGDYAFYGVPLTSIVIPDSVTTIGEGAFKNCQDLTTATIGSGVTDIGNEAFAECVRLTFITIPDSVISIGDYAFGRCSGLATLTLGSGLTVIGDSTFEYCLRLTSVVIPDGVTTIEDYAFGSCSKLETVTLGSGTISISETAFDNCSNIRIITVPEDNPSYVSVDGVLFNKDSTELILYPAEKSGDSYTIPSTVITVWDHAFSHSKLKTITIPDSVTSIGDGAFSHSSLTNVNLGSGITSISDGAFESCYGLKSMNIPEGVTIIGGSAFEGCSQLTSVTIPNTVTEIGHDAFSGCESITSIVIPDSVTTMGDDVFEYCISLTSVTIGSGITAVPNYAFYCCKKLTSIVIPDTVTSIGDWAFYSCSSLTTVSIGKGLTYMDSEPFRDCKKLESFTVADANTEYKSVDGILFNKAGTVLIKYPAAKTGTSYTVPDGVTELGSDAFRQSNLVSITIGKDLSSLTVRAFYDCSKLESFTVADANTEFSSVDGILFNKDGTHLLFFPENNSASSYNIPETVTDIEENAFHECTRLVTVNIPGSVINIDDYAFGRCKNLEAINVSESNEEYSSVGGVLFNKDKTTLMKYPEKRSETSFTMPNTVAYINNDAFDDCVTIKTLTFSDNLTDIDAGLLNGCTGLVTVTIGQKTTYIDVNVFDALWNLEAINVSESNEEYSSVDGVLFNKTKTELIMYPEAKKGESYSVPDTVVSLGNSAFRNNWTVESITLPAGLKSIGDYSFYGAVKLKSFTVPESNAAFTSADGVLRYKNGNGLVWCPSKWSGTLVIDDGISSEKLNADLGFCDSIKGFEIKEGSILYTVKGSALYYGNEIVGYASASDDSSLNIGASDSYVRVPFIYDAENLTEITVDPENYYFSSTEGSMYYKDGKTLCVCPSGKKSFTFPSAVTGVRSMAFTGDKLTEITFVKDSKVTVDMRGIYNCSSLKKIVIEEGADVTFEMDSILFDDTEEHTIYVVAPEGYTLDTSGYRSNVKIVYGEPPSEESKDLQIFVLIGTAVAAFAVIGVAVYFVRKN